MMKENIDSIFLFLAFLSLSFSLIDFFLEADVYGGFLALFWGLLFLFIAFKRYLLNKIQHTLFRALYTVLIVGVVLAGMLKLLFKLKIIT